MGSEQVGEIHTSADRVTVWSGLADSALLERCVVGVTAAVDAPENATPSVMAVGVQLDGQPVLFDTTLQFAEDHLHEQGALVLRATNSAVGGIDGVVRLQLTDDGAGTRLRYVGKVEVAGGLKAYDKQLIDRLAHQQLSEFFANFGREMNAFAPKVIATPESNTQAGRSSESYQPSQQGVVWAIMFGVLILAVILTL